MACKKKHDYPAAVKLFDNLIFNGYTHIRKNTILLQQEVKLW